MQTVFTEPSAIEAESMRLISGELVRRNVSRPEEEMQVIRRVIHATADFEFAETMVFSEGAVRKGREALAAGKSVITDTNMALSGISRPACLKYGNDLHCFTADPAVFEEAKAEGCTRSYAAMGYAAEHFPDAVYAIGNAPTALFRLEEELLQTDSFFPSLIIAVPVGYVNVIEAKQQILRACMKRGVPVIAAVGRKGGSTVCAAVMNALLYGITASR